MPSRAASHLELVLLRHVAAVPHVWMEGDCVPMESKFGKWGEQRAGWGTAPGAGPRQKTDTDTDTDKKQIQTIKMKTSTHHAMRREQW